MIINLRKKDTLIIDEFKFKCCVGIGGFNKNKKEGDKSTPKGTFKLGNLYWRPDRVKKPETKLICKKITNKMAWCNDIRSKKYNREIFINKKFSFEKIFRKDYKYNYFILIKYNFTKTIPGKGSAIFIHLTKKYKKTAGCIALKEKDFLILLKLINKNSKIIIS
tara:strand:- start:211 stop:702 length:492 start_codon:yes stop_codon:yes gene_type:complete